MDISTSFLTPIKNALLNIDNNLTGKSNQYAVYIINNQDHSIQTKFYSSKSKSRFAYLKNSLYYLITGKNFTVLKGKTGKENLSSYLVRRLTNASMELDNFNNLMLKKLSTEQLDAISTDAVFKEIQEINGRILGHIKNKGAFFSKNQQLVEAQDLLNNRLSFLKMQIHDQKMQFLSQEIERMPKPNLTLLGDEALGKELQELFSANTEIFSRIQNAKLSPADKVILNGKLIETERERLELIGKQFNGLVEKAKKEAQNLDTDKLRLAILSTEAILKVIKDNEDKYKEPAIFLIEKTENLLEAYEARRQSLELTAEWNEIMKNIDLAFKVQVTEGSGTLEDVQSLMTKLKELMDRLKKEYSMIDPVSSEKIQNDLIRMNDASSLYVDKLKNMRREAMKQEIAKLLLAVKIKEVNQITKFEYSDFRDTLLRFKAIDDMIKEGSKHFLSDEEIHEFQSLLVEKQKEFIKKNNFFYTVQESISKVTSIEEVQAIRKVFQERSADIVEFFKFLKDNPAIIDAVKQMTIFNNYIPDLINKFSEIENLMNQKEIEIQKSKEETGLREKARHVPLKTILDNDKYKEIIDYIKSKNDKLDIYNIDNLNETIKILDKLIEIKSGISLTKIIGDKVQSAFSGMEGAISDYRNKDKTKKVEKVSEKSASVESMVIEFDITADIDLPVKKSDDSIFQEAPGALSKIKGIMKGVPEKTVPAIHAFPLSEMTPETERETEIQKAQLNIKNNHKLKLMKALLKELKMLKSPTVKKEAVEQEGVIFRVKRYSKAKTEKRTKQLKIKNERLKMKKQKMQQSSVS